MSRWADEFETEILGQTPCAKCAKCAKTPQNDPFGTFGTFGTGKTLQQWKTDHERVLSLRSIPDIDEPHNDDAKEGRRIIAAVEAAGGNRPRSPKGGSGVPAAGAENPYVQFLPR